MSGRLSFLFIATDYKPRLGGIADGLDNYARGIRHLGDTAKVLAVVEAHKRDRLEFLRHYEEWVIPFEIVFDKKPANRIGRKFVSALEVIRCTIPAARVLLERTSCFAASTRAVRNFEQILKKEAPAVIVFAHLDIRLYPFAIYLKERKIPYGVMAHDFEVYRLTEKKNGYVVKGLMLRGAEWLTANSRHTRSLLEMWGIPTQRIKIVHPPIAGRALEIAPDAPAKPKDNGEIRLVSICRMVKPKGIDIVIRALRILNARGVFCHYDVAGSGPERSALEELAATLGLAGQVHFRGAITDDEKWALLRNSDIYVMPSRVDPKVPHEGFGIAFIEAAAFGLPSVGSTGGGIPDAVVDGETGLLVPEDSPERLAGALMFLCQNPQRRLEMGQAGQARARKHFPRAVVAARLQQAVREFAQNRLQDHVKTARPRNQLPADCQPES